MKPRSTNERNGSGSGAQAVERALAILVAVGGARSEPSLTDLAGTLGLHKTTVYRLLGALERGRFVEHDAERRRYRLGPSLVRLAAQARRSAGLYEAAHPELEAIATETGEAATLELLVGDEVLILDEVHGRFLIGSSPEVGMRWPAHATSTGKVLLAAARYGAAGSGAAYPVSKGRLVRRGPNTITSRAALERELAEVWRRGYAVALEESEADFVAVGAPVRDAHGRIVAAISVGGPTTRVTGPRITQLADRVCAGAATISQRLGAPVDARTRLMTDPPRSARSTQRHALPTTRPVA